MSKENENQNVSNRGKEEMILGATVVLSVPTGYNMMFVPRWTSLTRHTESTECQPSEWWCASETLWLVAGMQSTWCLSWICFCRLEGNLV